jgi:hypothetical protein
MLIDHGTIPFRPFGERRQRRHQRQAQFREPVLDARRDLRVHPPMDQPRPLQGAQPFRQLLLGDRIDGPLEMPEADGLLGLVQGEQDVDSPLRASKSV